MRRFIIRRGRRHLLWKQRLGRIDYDLKIDGVNKIGELARKNRAQQLSTPSQNVTNLQRRVAGILPVRIEVPRSGRSYGFVRTLVVDEETEISFQYKSR